MPLEDERFADDLRARAQKAPKSDPVDTRHERARRIEQHAANLAERQAREATQIAAARQTLDDNLRAAADTGAKECSVALFGFESLLLDNADNAIEGWQPIWTPFKRRQLEYTQAVYGTHLTKAGKALLETAERLGLKCKYRYYFFRSRPDTDGEREIAEGLELHCRW